MPTGPSGTIRLLAPETSTCVFTIPPSVKFGMPAPDPISSQRRYNTRLGMVLFAIYLLLYLGFVLINAFNADLMERAVLSGLNLAIVYGFGLIIAALILALVYGAMCQEESSDQGDSE